jgi:hypothetical protein
MQNRSTNAVEQTQLSLLQEKIFTRDHTVQEVLNVLDEVIFDWMASDYADDSHTRYRVLHAHKNIKDTLYSVAFNEVTSEVELIMKINL